MIKRLKLKHQLYFLLVLVLLLFGFFNLLYYVGFSVITYQRIDDSAEQMVVQVVQNVQQMAENVKNSAMGLSYNKHVQELMVSEDRVKNIQLYEYVGELASTAKASNNTIYGVNWVNNNLRKISDPVRDENGVVTKLEEMYDFTDEEFRKPVFSSVVQGDNKLFYYGYIFPVYAADMSKIGCGVLVLNIWELEKLVKINNITENSLFIILDQNDNVVVSNRGLKTGDRYDTVFWDGTEKGIIKKTLKYNGIRSLAQCMQIEENGWKVVSIIPRRELLSDIYTVIRIGIVLAVVSMFLLVLCGHTVIKNIMQPIDVIVDFLQQSETNILKSRITTPLYNEIALIASNINSMLDRIEHMTRKIVENQTLLYEAKLTEQEAELHALQSQINPHFLYNTLNCLSNIGLAYDIPQIADISVAMSNIYRYSIKGDKLVSLSDELQCIREYMKIMDIRFNGKFETEYRLDEELLKLYTLRMILQPIVENAVYHGMEQKSGKGKLLIEGKILEEDKLILSVRDDGKAMNTKQVEEVRKGIQEYEKVGLYHTKKSSIGLGNINKRIKLQFGGDFGLQVESEESVGTEVTLLLPVIREK